MDLSNLMYGQWITFDNEVVIFEGNDDNYVFLYRGDVDKYSYLANMKVTIKDFNLYAKLI